MRVPLLDLKAQLLPLREEIIAAVTGVIDSTCYIMGPELEKLEKGVAEYCGAAYAIGVSSGTDALLISLMALDIGPGDLVATTPYTFFATMGAVLRLGARPVFVDIDPETYNIDPRLLAHTLADHERAGRPVKAIIPVHLYGQCAEMRTILELAARYNIPVIEDAAQAIGASYPMAAAGGVEWRRAGAMGTTGCFSFFPSKNLGGIGDGGMVTTNDLALAERLRQLRVHGMAPKYYHSMVGGNFRMDPVQAAVLNVKLPRLPEWHRARRRNASCYNRLFAEAGLLDAGKVRIPTAVFAEQPGAEAAGADHHIYNQYVIRVEQRDALKAFLDKEGVGVEIYYPIPMHKQECVAGLGYNELSLPEAEKAAANTLALPVYPELTEEMQVHVVERIRTFYR